MRNLGVLIVGNGYVVVEHGDRQPPVWSRVTVRGVLITDFCRDAGIPWNETIGGMLRI